MKICDKLADIKIMACGGGNLQCSYEADQIRFYPPRRPLDIVDTRKKIDIRLIKLVVLEYI